MKTVRISKELILANCRDLVSEKGLSNLNIREVAKTCGVSVGSIYYYFPSKNDLVIASIESVWEDIFSIENLAVENVSFLAYIGGLLKNIEKTIKKYPNFFTIHSISLSSKAKPKAKSIMDRYLEKIRVNLSHALELDEKVDDKSFTETFTKEEFIDFVLVNIMYLLMKKTKDYKILLEIISRTIY